MSAKTTSIPDTHVLNVLLREYREMLAEAQRGINKLLSLDPQQEEFWDQLSELDPTITLIESRSGSIEEEIDELVDQLPED
jgi:hypothetical protein